MAISKEARGHGMEWEEGYCFSQALKVGDTIHISGQFSHDEAGNFVGTGDVEAQVRQAYENIKRLLSQYSAGVDNIVDEMIFVTDIKGSFDAVSRVRKEIYAGLVPPANTLVQVARLTMGRQLVEIKCTARL